MDKYLDDIVFNYVNKVFKVRFRIILCSCGVLFFVPMLYPMYMYIKNGVIVNSSISFLYYIFLVFMVICSVIICEKLKLNDFLKVRQLITYDCVEEINEATDVNEAIELLCSKGKVQKSSGEIVDALNCNKKDFDIVNSNKGAFTIKTKSYKLNANINLINLLGISTEREYVYIEKIIC